MEQSAGGLSEFELFKGILEEELVPAMGCTEPIALAYAAAAAKEYLCGEEPLGAEAQCSSNILKNVMCVRVPNTGGLVGVEAAVNGGLFGGDASRRMEVLSGLDDADREKIRRAMDGRICKVSRLETQIPLHIILTVRSAHHEAMVEITWKHTHIARIVADGKEQDLGDSVFVQKQPIDRSILTVEKILYYAEHVDLDDIRSLIERQIRDNMAIAEEGLRGGYGLNIGRVILKEAPSAVKTKMLAFTAAASEARMEGCPLSVVTNSGSGNQGIAASVPVVIYCRESGISEERMYRALVLSNLLTVHQKTGIGELSAFCGAVCASIASAAAVTWLKGGTLREIDATVNNSYGSVTGTICDGAKATCGYKIYSALSAALLAGEMALEEKSYAGNTGILKGDVEDTIRVVGTLGREGMVQTDEKILDIMLTD